MAPSPTAVTAVDLPSQSAFQPRRALRAGLDFLHVSADPRWGVRGAQSWFAEHLVAPGYMRAPSVLTEPGAGSLSLHESGVEGLTSSALFPRIVAVARIRVITALRGLIASPTDDRFLSAAIFAGRVKRLRVQGASQWVPQPEHNTPLSGVVLSLFAVDVLTHRDEYDKRLCVCDACDRVTFQDGAVKRKSCPDHLPQVSGLMRRVTPPSRKPNA